MSKPITTSNVMEKARQAFFKEMSAGIDMNALNEILSEEYEITVGDEMEFKEGRIATSNGQIFYELLYEISLSLRIQLDGEGHPESVRMDVLGEKARQTTEEKSSEDRPEWIEKAVERENIPPTEGLKS